MANTTSYHSKLVGVSFEGRQDVIADIKQLEEYIEALDGKDITANYEDWMIVMFGLAYSLGETFCRFGVPVD